MRSLDMTTMETFPPARVPLRPVLAGSELGNWASAQECPSVMHAGETALVTSGRIAVALALSELHLAPGSEVLIPAYHCSSMVEPVIWSGAKPVFLKISPNGDVDMRDVQAKIGKHT